MDALWASNWSYKKLSIAVMPKYNETEFEYPYCSFFHTYASCSQIFSHCIYLSAFNKCVCTWVYKFSLPANYQKYSQFITRFRLDSASELKPWPSFKYCLGRAVCQYKERCRITAYLLLPSYFGTDVIAGWVMLAVTKFMHSLTYSCTLWTNACSFQVGILTF